MTTRGNQWVTEPDQVLEPRMNSSKYGSLPPKTVIQVFNDIVAVHGNRPAMGLKRMTNGVLPEDYKIWTYIDYQKDCRAFAKSIIHLNVANFGIVNILGFNSPEWFIANTGALFGGAIAAGIYATNSAEACHYITEHGKAEIVVVEGNAQLAKYSSIINSLPSVKAMIVWGEPIKPELAAKFVSVQVYTWEDFLMLGMDVPDFKLDEKAMSISPGNCASLIYTSGTTGPPKAVMISHDNITWTANNINCNYMDLNHEDCVISYLPLSHIAAQLVDIHGMMGLGGCTYFAQPDALKGTLTKTMKEVRPTFFFGVPRVWEKIQEKMVQLGRETTGIKKSISTWAKGVGAEHSKLQQWGRGGGKPWGYGCANSIVLSKIKAALGLDRVKGCYTAAAPISIDTLNYFASLDIHIYEVFGQSECTGPHTVSAANQWKVGYCGRPMLGTESMIAPGTGELCYRGRHIFMGYMYMPDKTAETIDEEGYLHSGDVAEFDDAHNPNIPKPSGFMKITGRIKELIITAGGENVPPVLIEDQMKTAMVAISNVMVIGDKRKFLSMVVSLKTDTDLETGLPTDTLAVDSLFVAQQIGSSATTYTAAKVDPLWAKYVDEGMKKANSRTTSNAQIIQKWAWLPVDFSEKAGELTPTLKLKRNVVTEKYATLIDSIYVE
eukprot:gene15852-21480_t